MLGTLLGAVCFLVGAALMLPAWRQIPPTAGEATAARLIHSVDVTTEGAHR